MYIHITHTYTHWWRKVVKPGGVNRQTRKYFYSKKSYGALLKSGGAATHSPTLSATYPYMYT